MTFKRKLAIVLATGAASLAGTTTAYAENSPTTLVAPLAGVASGGGLFGPGMTCDSILEGLCIDVFGLDLSAFSSPLVSLSFEVRSTTVGPFGPVPSLGALLMNETTLAIVAGGAGDPVVFSAIVDRTVPHFLAVGGANLGDGGAYNLYSVALSAAPVPEPESVALMLAGLGIVGLALRRRKNAIQS